MTDYERRGRNLGKLATMAVFSIGAIVVFSIVLGWPMALWMFFGQPLSLAVAITIVWIAAIL